MASSPEDVEHIECTMKAHVFNVKALNNQTLVAKDPIALDGFRKDVSALSRKVNGVGEIMKELEAQLGLVQSALLNYPNTDLQLVQQVRTLKLGLDSCMVVMYGDGLLSKHEFESAPSLTGRLGMVEYMIYDNTAGATASQKANLMVATDEYALVSAHVKRMLMELNAIEEKLANVPIPYTRSRGLTWKED